MKLRCYGKPIKPIQNQFSSITFFHTSLKHVTDHPLIPLPLPYPRNTPCHILSYRDFHTLGLTSLIEKMMGKIPGSMEEQLGVFEGEQHRMGGGATTGGGEEKENTPLLLSPPSSTSSSTTTNAPSRVGIYPSTATTESSKLLV